MAILPIVKWNIPLDSYAIKKGAVPQLNSKGWDEAVMSIIWRGTYAGLLDEFNVGAENMPGIPSGARMFCQGIIGRPEAKFGGIWADVGWVGSFNPPSLANVGLMPDVASPGGNIVPGVKAFTSEVTTQEIELPQQVGDNTVLMGTGLLPAGKPPINPDSGEPWKGRVIDDIHVRTYQGIHIGTPSAPPSAPRCSAGDPDTTNPINWSDSGSKGARMIRRVNYWPGKTGSAGAWIRKDFSCNLDYALGSVALYSWSATFEWREEYSA